MTPLFPRTDYDTCEMGVEVVHFGADDSPAKRSVMPMDYLLSPLDAEKQSRDQRRG
ncbi:hypothetical protein [Thalassovita aquimarina]|uniref:hypothetical protein n=1 Tax=Thalassovita aquimarina TaxID=2785917 RepID=UPI001BAEAFD9|nr:hypothetical protein [Thalassovita aquimarina]